MPHVRVSQLLVLPKLDRYPSLVKEVAMEALADMMFDLADGDVDTVDDHYYYTLLRDRLYDEDGDVRSFTCDVMEQQAFVKDSIGSIRYFEDQIRDLLEQVMSLNAEVFRGVYEAIDFTSIKIGGEYNNSVLLIIEGDKA